MLVFSDVKVKLIKSRVVVGFVVAVVAVGIGVRLGCSGGWQWLAVGIVVGLLG